MQELSNESGSTTIQHDPIIQRASEFHGINLNFTKSNVIRYFMKLGTSIILLVLGLILNIYFLEEDKTSSTISFSFKIINFSVYFIFATAIFVLISLILDFTHDQIKASSSRGNFITGILKQFPHQIAFMISSIIISLLIGFGKPDVTPVVVAAAASASTSKKQKEVSDHLEALLDENLAGFFMGLALATAIILTKNIIIFTLNFNVHFAYYSERIRINTEKINMLRKLNELINAGYSDDLSKICMRLVETFPNTEENHLDFLKLKKSIGDEEVYKIIRYMYLEKNTTSVSYDELYGLYISTLSEQQQLSVGLTQKNASVESLNFVSSIICYLVAISVFISNINPEETSKNYGYIIMTGMLSGGYIFSDTLKKFLGSLIFVFFIRPFEIEDMVIIDHKIYKVREINIMTTTFTENMLHISYPNSKLLDTVITNLRCSKSCDEYYTFDFAVEEFRAKQENLIRHLNRIMREGPKTFKRKAYFTKIKIVSTNVIRVSIVVSFNFENLEMSVIQENKDGFELRLHDLLKEHELVPFAK